MGLIVDIRDIDDSLEEDLSEDEFELDEDELDEVTEESEEKDKEQKNIKLTDFTIKKYSKRLDELKGKNEYLEKALLGIELYGKINIFDRSKEILEVNKLAKWSKDTAHEKEAYKDVKIRFFDNNNEVYDKMHFKNGFVVVYKESFDEKEGNGEFYVFIREFLDKVEFPKKAEKKIEKIIQSTKYYDEIVLYNNKMKDVNGVLVAIPDDNKMYADSSTILKFYTGSKLDSSKTFTSSDVKSALNGSNVFFITKLSEGYRRKERADYYILISNINEYIRTLINITVYRGKTFIGTYKGYLDGSTKQVIDTDGLLKGLGYGSVVVLNGFDKGSYYSFGGHTINKTKFLLSGKNINLNNFDLDTLCSNIKDSKKDFASFSYKWDSNSKTATINIEGPKLTGKVIHIDVGHGSLGGPSGIMDPGAIGYLDGIKYYEADVALKISLYLKKYLEEQGATVYISHTNVTQAIEYSQRNVNANSPNLIISVHLNSNNDPQKNGALVLYRIFQNKKTDRSHDKRLCGYFEFQNIAIQIEKVIIDKIIFM